MGRRRHNGNGRGNKKRGRVQPSTRRSPSPDMADYSLSGSEHSTDSDAPLAFGIGTRVEFPHLEGYSAKGSHPHTGTVAGHWKRRDHWAERVRAPYLVLLDDGTAVYCHRTDAEFLRESDVPPMEAAHGVGSRVECRLEAGDAKWFPGTVLQRNRDWTSSPCDTPPYLIRFDYGRERPFWGPSDRIRAFDCYRTEKFPSLRFELGDCVLCSIDDGWVPGQIVKRWYREDDFAKGYAAPYQVLLDTGELIYTPMDNNDCIRKLTSPPAPLRFEVGDSVTCRVEEGWEPGIISNTEYRKDGFYNGRTVPYEIKLDSGDCVYAPCDNDLFIRKQLRFREGHRVNCFVDNEWMPGTVLKTELEDDDFDLRFVPYQVQLDTGDTVSIEADDDSHIQQSNTRRACRGEHNGFVRVMSKILIFNKDFDEAEKMLLERIDKIRPKTKNNTHDSTLAYWRVDLAYFLIYLSEVYQARGCLGEMKLALNESLNLTETSCDKSKRHRLLDIKSKLAMHAALSSDKYAALEYTEEAITLAKETTRGNDSFRLGLMMLQCGKLNVGCGKRPRGLTQMSEGLKILTRLYGCDNKHVLLANDDLQKILSSDELS